MDCKSAARKALLVQIQPAPPNISRQSPNANPVGNELTRLCRCSQYIVGAVPTGKEFRSVRIEVITGDCLSLYRSSSLLQTAKLNATVAQRKSRRLIISWSGCRNSPVAPSFV